MGDLRNPTARVAMATVNMRAVYKLTGRYAWGLRKNYKILTFNKERERERDAGRMVRHVDTAAFFSTLILGSNCVKKHFHNVRSDGNLLIT